MPSNTRPATRETYTQRHGFVNHLCRFGNSRFTRDTLIVLAVAGYIVGLCYLCTFLLSHPILLALFIVGAATLALCWVARGAQ